MADYGVRMQFANELNERSWTEIFYISSGLLPGNPGFEGLFQNICEKRADSLVTSNTLATITVWNLLTPSTTYVLRLALPGTIPAPAADNQDIAPASVLMQLRAGVRRRQYLMRGIADADIRNGRFQPRAAVAAGYLKWRQFITEQPMGLRLSTFLPLPPVSSISAGVITLSGVLATPLAAGTLLAVSTAVAGGGPSVSTRVRVSSPAADGQNLIHVRWGQGNCTGGSVRTVSYSVIPFTEVLLRSAARTRKTGGPTSPFRGRR